MPARHSDARPRVSVVIPTYNRAWILREAVDSVLSQDFGDFELIVVDDGSTDHTRDILHRYGDRVRVLFQNNRGVSTARNRGIAAAAGELIAFLDSDDLWLPKKLRTQVDFFQHHCDALICQTEERWIRKGVRVNPGKRHRKPAGMIFEASLHLCLVSPSAVMARRRLFDRVGAFDVSLPACEDYDLWLRVACRYAVHLIETPLVVKRGGHADQLSRQPMLDKYRIRSLSNIIRSGLLSADQRRAATRVLNQKCAIYAAGCRKRGRLKEAEYYETLAGDERKP
jgi:glycosyltransferase involved in cell wall biosynthesis